MAVHYAFSSTQKMGTRAGECGGKWKKQLTLVNKLLHRQNGRTCMDTQSRTHLQLSEQTCGVDKQQIDLTTRRIGKYSADFSRANQM